MPFIGFAVRLCAKRLHSTVIGSGPIHVAVDDRRLDAARAVALHPAVGGEGVAPQLLAEILDHVVALGSPCTSTSRPSSSCLLHRQADFVAHRAPGSPDGSSSPRLWALRAWRMAAVCGNEPMVVVGNSGSCHFACCCLDALRESRMAPAVAVADLAQVFLHQAVVDAARAAARGNGGARCRERLLGAGGVAVQAARQRRHLVQLLHGERQPAFQLVVERAFLRQIDRHVQQRAARRKPQPIAEARLERLQHGQQARRDRRARCCGRR